MRKIIIIICGAGLKKLKWFGGSGFLLLVVFMLWLHHDEPLSQETQQLLSLQEGYKPELKTHPYFFMLGFDAKQNVDPMVLGRLRYHQDWANYFQHKQNLSGQPSALELKLTSSGTSAETKQLLSDFKRQYQTEQSFDMGWIVQHKIQIQKAIQRDYGWIERYQTLLQQSPQSELLQPPDAVWANYGLLMNVHYLYLMNLLTSNQPAQQLQQYIEHLTQSMSRSNHLVDQMVLVEKINTSTQLLHDLNRKEHHHLSLDGLSLQQLSMRKTLAMEANIMVLVNPFNVTHSSESGDGVTFWQRLALPFVYLPHMTTNQYVRDLQQVIVLSEMNYADFKKDINHLAAIKPDHIVVKNFVGNILMQIGGPSMQKYLIKMRQLDHTILLFNVLNSQQTWNVQSLNQNKEGYEFYQTDTRLCIKSPYLEKTVWNEDRCMSL